MVSRVNSGNRGTGNLISIIRLDAEGLSSGRGRTGEVFPSDIAAFSAGDAESDDCSEKKGGHIPDQRRNVSADRSDIERSIYGGVEMKRLIVGISCYFKEGML